ncbi:eukaryotic translation initiation factor 5 [Sitodiplosis mosellana]|uniref:eukaryotic translation initiation factor 5 n=1 Tax=Sitodiplosis mosellana TaxID=263140 RepID=UPI002443C76E|nr:eukaryotic translation initiation factor 5 [Sitodiplosis mosellana]XP_055312839.1 eukaryotic translation initiation factor 5 [Sitodiplosis mosellana]XP_055312848.1 eukaryotic translation initiation factor 5 [Sitodiplosis mosellana]XP_055312857.1 eukaryotic translation initiation factor 5 [Sitodiplosis mosellana]XP_055312868.1 eukaryotic translation initiation factor 5 [Sitodiplosis mosellana]XP_055312879.1 eukaryotic translation initiation factor 5 [Sitodiplosis mosellana]XP_055312889.1 eu
MGSVNVNRNVTDLFYRYKMPRISAKVEGKGNGIKTVIVNMAEVAKAIGRPATYPTKYFGCELGAQTQFDYKHERFIVNGSHDPEKLQDLLDGFIRKYVLCPECDNPETDLKVQSKKGTISQSCKACGFHGPLEVHHKVNTFIIKNPPNINPATQGSSLTEGKRSKRSKKTGENGDANNSMADGDTSVVSNSGEETLSHSKSVVEEEDDDTTWTTDVSEEAVRARMYDLSDGAMTMTISDDSEKSEKERIDIFYEFVKKRRDANQLDNVQVHKEIATEAERLDITQKAPLVLAELVFSANIITEVKKHRNLLLRFTHDNQKAQRYLLGGIEQIISLHADKLLDKVAGIFKLFYDSDILEEKSILEWSEKVSKKYVTKEMSEKIHEKAKPFIQWLREADEESSEEEDDSDLEIEYNDRARVEPLRAEKPAPAVKKAAAGDEEDDDLDIDDI